MVAILARSEQEFGGAARDRYAALMLQAMRDIAEEPTRPGATLDVAIDPTCRFYHIKHSRARVTKSSGRVGEPRHVLVYEIGPDGVIPDRDDPDSLLGFPGRVNSDSMPRRGDSREGAGHGRDVADHTDGALECRASSAIGQMRGWPGGPPDASAGACP
jgi:toxin ParE1/3/4